MKDDSNAANNLHFMVSTVQSMLGVAFISTNKSQFRNSWACERLFAYFFQSQQLVNEVDSVIASLRCNKERLTGRGIGGGLDGGPSSSSSTNSKICISEVKALRRGGLFYFLSVVLRRKSAAGVS